MQHFPFLPPSSTPRKRGFVGVGWGCSPFLPTPLAPNLSSSSCLLLCKERSRLSCIYPGVCWRLEGASRGVFVANGALGLGGLLICLVGFFLSLSLVWG